MGSFFPTAVIIIIGAIGILCALTAWQQLRGEFVQLARLREFFSDGQGPLYSLEPDKYYTMRPAEWLRDHQIVLESHAADHLLAVWGGWHSNRLPTLGELHSLSARRERARGTARWAGGIGAVLLVCGVAGTLWAIHPVLNRFTIEVNADGTVQDASRSAENVMSMIHQLGTSFYPSIAAILFTLFIILARSAYHRSAYHLGRELDRFAVDSLLPAFRLPTIGQEFEETRIKLGNLADSVARRDTEFATAVESLAEIIKDMRAAGPALSTAAKQVATAANRLSTDATQIVNGLIVHFGKDGALVQSITGFKESVTRSQEAAAALTGASKKMEDTARALTNAAQHVPGALEKGCADGIARFTEQAKQTFDEGGRQVAAVIERAGAPLDAAAAKIQSAGQELQANSQSAKASISTVLGEAKNSLDAAASQLQKGTEAATERLVKSFGDDIRQPLDGSIAHLIETQRQVSDSLEVLSEFAAQATRLPQPGKLVEAADRVSAVTEELQSVVERLERPETAGAVPAPETEEEKPWYRLFGR